MLPKFHKNLDIKSWQNQDIFDVMGNIGSEVSRAIKWKSKNREKQCKEALYRSLELFDLSINNKNLTSAQLGELLRAREVWVDFIFGDNDYNSSSANIQRYFDQFAIARKRKVKDLKTRST
ncbi:hypothetical protein KC660_04650 [Candidatus Dojkabacteria bacterium]|uniref:Uncharacterized protein n=1 Tax=Candidatus Dojkabacteria bacterium TaxID=2099670 RepID=A0A955RIS3_9BACT|nr:hypothetical protein [Candidatus Dojkabacteria bacterium]